MEKTLDQLRAERETLNNELLRLRIEKTKLEIEALKQPPFGTLNYCHVPLTEATPKAS